MRAEYLNATSGSIKSSARAIAAGANSDKAAHQGNRNCRINVTMFAIGMPDLRKVSQFGCAAGLLVDPVEIRAEALRHWDSDDFRKFVGVGLENRLLQGRVTRARRLDEHRYFVCGLDHTLPMIN